MRISDLVKVSFSNLKHSRSAIVITILISISSIAVIFGISFSNSFDNYFEEYVEKNIDFRIFSVLYEDIKDKKFINTDRNSLSVEEKVRLFDEAEKETIDIINNVLYVNGITTTDGYMAGIESIKVNNEKVVEGISLIGIPFNTLINLKEGNLLNQYNQDDNVMLCPNYFQSDLEKFHINNDRDVRPLLNKELIITFAENKTLNYKIVGLFDKVSTYAIGNACYTSYENLKEIKHDLYIKNKEINSQYANYNGEGLYLMIDNREHLKIIEDELSKYGIYIEPIVHIDTSIVDNILNVCRYIAVISLIVTSIIVFMNLLINHQRRNKEFFLYNALGYSKTDIGKLIFCENTMIGIISFIVAIVISLIIFEIFENLILVHNARLYLLELNLDLSSLVYGLLITLLIPIISSIVILVINKSYKQNIME